MSQSKLKKTRAEETERISQRLREVALHQLASIGVDGMSMVQVAKEAQTSKSPLYRRYDDSIDLCVDVWDHHLREHLQLVLRYTQQLATNGDEKALKWLTGQMRRPSSESAALIECLSVARRFEYLLEAVEIDLDRELQSYLEGLPNLPTDVALSYVVYVLGGLFVGPLLPGAQRDYVNAFALWHKYLQDESLRVNRPMPTEIRPIPLSIPTSEDQTLGDLISAATKVIMRTGFEKATANRIARYANKAFSSSYSYFDSKEDLMTYATEFVFRDSIVRNDMMFVSGDDQQRNETSASRIRELSTVSASEDVRLFRIEATLAARHHRRLRTAIEALFQQSLDQMMFVTKKKKDLQDEVHAVWLGVRIAGFGHNVFGLVNNTYRDINWMSTANAAAILVQDHAMAHYVEDAAAEMAS